MKDLKNLIQDTRFLFLVVFTAILSSLLYVLMIPHPYDAIIKEYDNNPEQFIEIEKLCGELNKGGHPREKLNTKLVKILESFSKPLKLDRVEVLSLSDKGLTFSIVYNGGRINLEYDFNRSFQQMRVGETKEEGFIETRRLSEEWSIWIDKDFI